MIGFWRWSLAVIYTVQTEVLESRVPFYMGLCRIVCLMLMRPIFIVLHILVFLDFLCQSQTRTCCIVLVSIKPEYLWLRSCIKIEPIQTYIKVECKLKTEPKKSDNRSRICKSKQTTYTRFLVWKKRKILVWMLLVVYNRPWAEKKFLDYLIVQNTIYYDLKKNI